MESELLKGRTFSSKFKFIWGLANLGGALISGVYGALLQYFYHVYLNLGSEWISLAALIYAIWNAINDPLFGYISDSSKGKNGRRIPFMRYTAPFLGLTFILVWLIPQGMMIENDQIVIFWWMLITMLLYDTCYTIVFLMYSALLPEITESDRERGELQKYSGLFYLLGTILGFLLPDYFRPKVGDLNMTSLYLGVTIIGVIGAVMILITSYYVKERPEFTQVDQPLSSIDSIKYTFKSKSFLILTAANFMSIFMQAIIINEIYYLSDYVLKTSSIMPLIFIFLGLLIGTIIANKLAVLMGVVQGNQLLLFISGIFLISLPFLPNSLIYIALLFAGFGLSGPLVLTNILYAQVADEDELNSGVRREAAFFGTNALLTKPAQSIALAIGPFLLDSVGFISAGSQGIVVDQPDAVVFSIKLLIGLIPGIAMLLGALFLKWYPLKGQFLRDVQQRVLRLHAEKHAKLGNNIFN